MSAIRMGFVALSLLVSATNIQAQTPAPAWPAAQPIKVIIPFTAGSATDVIARTVFEQVGSQIGQTFVIDNRVGASGTLGANAVAKADPDGYTLLVNSSSHTITPSTFGNLPYDTEKDFAAVIPLANLANVLVVAPAKYKSVKDLVDAGRAKSGTQNYALGRRGQRLACQCRAIPARSQGQGAACAVQGRARGTARDRRRPDRLLFHAARAGARADQRRQAHGDRGVVVAAVVKALPNVPTTIEAGFPNSEYNFWIGVFAPAKTPTPILERLHKEIAAALANPAVAEKSSRSSAPIR